jgi:glycerol-3-phosphate dehydrogenase (NAD(P)+)
MTIQRIAVLGGGAWGTALALTCARAGRNVTLWEYEPGNAASLEKKRESRFLPGVRIDNEIKVTRDLGDTANSEAILLVVPAQAVRSVVTSLASLVAKHTPLIVCAKGIEHGTHKFMTEIIAECAPVAVPAILSDQFRS